MPGFPPCRDCWEDANGSSSFQVQLRSCLKFLAILKRLDFQGPGTGFCLPVEGYSGSWARLSLSFAFFTSDSLVIFL